MSKEIVETRKVQTHVRNPECYSYYLSLPKTIVDQLSLQQGDIMVMRLRREHPTKIIMEKLTQ